MKYNQSVSVLEKRIELAKRGILTIMDIFYPLPEEYYSEGQAFSINGKLIILKKEIAENNAVPINIFDSLTIDTK